MHDETDDRSDARRRFLRLSGAAAASSLAGCSSSWSKPNDEPAGAGVDRTTSPRPTRGTETARADDAVPTLETKYRSRERFRSPGTSFDEMEDPSAWRTIRGSMRADTDHAFVGSKSARLVGHDGDHAIVETSFAPTDLSDRDVSVALRTTTPSAIAFFVQLLDVNGNAVENQLRSITWSAPDVGWFRTCPGTYTADDGFDGTRVTRLRLRVNNASDETAVAWVDDVRTHRKPDGGYVVLSWDDANRSFYRHAASLHDRYGVPAVLTHPPRTSYAGSGQFMSVNELRERQATGDEVVAHGSVLSRFDDVPRTELDGILRRNKRWLLDHGFEGADFVVYPGNDYDRTALEVVGRYHYMGGMNQAGSVNTTGVHGFDPLVLPRTIGHDLAISRRLVDRVAAHRNAGILNFHDFASENTMSVADYRSLLRYIDRTPGVEVVTFADLWEMRKAGS